MSQTALQSAARGLVLFHHVLEGEVGTALSAYADEPTAERSYPLARALWKRGTSLKGYIIDEVLHGDNPFSRAAEARALNPALVSVARHDLRHLGTLARHLPDGLVPLPPYSPEPDSMADRLAQSLDWPGLVEPLAEYIRAHGAGLMGRYHAFRWEDGALLGIAEPDPITLDELVGNQEAKAAVIRNTERFLQGLPAHNLLLYGDRGTGKSSTVKGLLHKYWKDGLRLVEVSRSDLGSVGRVMRTLRDRVQRFILFIDDLSFETEEVAYKSFKAVLEGSLERRPSNLLVYATSNRRHLIRERWSDRQIGESDDVNPKDTLEEMASLSDRFGMTIVFTTPDQEQYLRIVESLAASRSIPLPPEELRRQALQWALYHNGRSGRTARQFVDDLAGRLG